MSTQKQKYLKFELKQITKMTNFDENKGKLSTAAKTHPFICQRSFISKKSWKLKKLRPPKQQSTYKTDMIKVGLVFSISNFFNVETSLANNWRNLAAVIWL